MNINKQKPNWVTIGSLVFSVVVYLISCVASWTHTTDAVATITRRQDIQSAKIDVHTSQISAINADQAAMNAKMDMAQHSLDRIETVLEGSPPRLAQATK